jgi:hypothetical protein
MVKVYGTSHGYVVPFVEDAVRDALARAPAAAASCAISHRTDGRIESRLEQVRVLVEAHFRAHDIQTGQITATDLVDLIKGAGIRDKRTINKYIGRLEESEYVSTLNSHVFQVEPKWIPWVQKIAISQEVTT